VPVLQRQSRRYAGESHHSDHVLAVPGMRQDMDDCQSDTVTAPDVMGYAAPHDVPALASCELPADPQLIPIDR
jgi:hypothetical protein